MRLLDSLDDSDSIRLALKKLLHAGNDGRRRRAMPATSVRRDYQDFWDAIARHGLFFSWRLNYSVPFDRHATRLRGRSIHSFSCFLHFTLELLDLNEVLRIKREGRVITV